MSYRRFMLDALLFAEIASAAETSLPFPGPGRLWPPFGLAGGGGNRTGYEARPERLKAARRIRGSQSDRLISFPEGTMKLVKRLTIAAMSQVPC